jgi:hypothetical protein
VFPLIGFTQSRFDTTRSEITLRTFVENETVPANRELVFHIELQWKGDLSKYKINEVPEPMVINLTIRGSGSSNKVTSVSDGSTCSIKRRTFYFRPMEIGMAYIEGVKIKYEDTILKQEEFLISERIGVKIVDPLPEPGEMKIPSYVLIILAGVTILAIALFFYLRYQMRKKEEQARAQAEIKETVEEKYIRLLKETIHFNTDNVKDSLIDLSHLLNGYISERYNINTSSISTDQLIETLVEKEISDETIARIKDFYKTANLVKFAGETVNDADFHRLYDTVELILENQKLLYPRGEDK